MPERLTGPLSTEATPQFTMSLLARAEVMHKSTRVTLGLPAVVIFALLAAVGLAACSGNESADKEPVVSVQAEPAQRTNIQQKIVAEAILYPIHEAAITPKVSAPVLKFDVNRGDHVRAGQLLAVLENKDLTAAVTENQGVYEQAQADYANTISSTLPQQIQAAKADAENAKAALDAAQQVYDSSKNLYAQGALAKRQLDQAQVALIQAQTQQQAADQKLQKMEAVSNAAQQKSAAGQLAAAQGKYQGAQAQLAYSEIRSPIAGVVTDRPLYQGEMAAAGTPLITVMDVSRIVARAHIPESQAEHLKVGDPAEISSLDGTDKVSGKVTIVSPALDPSSTTVEIWAEAKNPNGQFKAGASVNLTMVSKSAADAIVVPKSALLVDPKEGSSVMVVGSDSHAHQRKVQTGIQEDDRVQIVQGLKEGEVVVTVGAYGLPDNVKVTVQKQSEGAAE
ncbi:MAG TPA: efflux RND transporter periplasmic adaptor subunit [Candidatus Acidoferrales bacterium]